MKLKLMPLVAGVLTLGVALAPLAAQACGGEQSQTSTGQDQVETGNSDANS